MCQRPLNPTAFVLQAKSCLTEAADGKDTQKKKIYILYIYIYPNLYILLMDKILHHLTTLPWKDRIATPAPPHSMLARPLSKGGAGFWTFNLL